MALVAHYVILHNSDKVEKQISAKCFYVLTKGSFATFTSSLGGFVR